MVHAPEPGREGHRCVRKSGDSIFTFISSFLPSVLHRLSSASRVKPCLKSGELCIVSRGTNHEPQYHPAYYPPCFCFSCSESGSLSEPERKPCRSTVTNLKPSDLILSTICERSGSATIFSMSRGLTSIRATVS